MEVKTSEDKENGLLMVRWTKDATSICEEFKDEQGNNFVLDYDKDNRIIGIEILTWKPK